MMPYNSVAFLINHVNLAVATKRRWIFLQYTKKIMHILFLLKKLGVLQSYATFIKSNSRKIIKLSPFFYKNMSFFRCVKLVSTPSKRFNIKLRTLQILTKSLGETVIVLETSRGILLHTDALKLGVGGKILLTVN